MKRNLLFLLALLIGPVILPAQSPSLIYGLERNTGNLMEIDPVSGNYQVIAQNPLPNDLYPLVRPTIDEDNDIFYNITNSNAQGQFFLVGYDIVNGTALTPVSVTLGSGVYLGPLHWDPVSGKIYTFVRNSNSIRLAELNPTNGSVNILTQLTAANDLLAAVVSGTALDPVRRRMYVLGYPSPGNSTKYFYSFDLNTGNVISRVPYSHQVWGNPYHLYFNCTDQQVYCMGGTSGSLAKINPDSVTFTQITNNSATPHVSLTFAGLDPDAGTISYIGIPGSGQSLLVTCRLSDGSVVSQHNITTGTYAAFGMLAGYSRGIARADFAAPASICSGNAANFNFTGRGNNVRWDFGDPASGSSNTATGPQAGHTFSGAGTYLVTAISDGCAGSDTISYALQVGEAIPVELGNDTTICPLIPLTLSAPATGSVRWSTGDTTASITVSQAGQYIVTVDPGFGCIVSDTINIATINNCGTVRNPNTGKPHSLSDLTFLKPNPASEEAFVEVAILREGPTEVAVFNLSGEQVFEYSAYHSSGRYEIPLGSGGWEEGLYLVRVRHGDEEVVFKRLIIK